MQRDRELTEVEKLIDLDRIETDFDEGMENLQSRILNIRNRQADQLSIDVVEIEPEQLTVLFKVEMADTIYEELKRMFQAGRDAVDEELDAQKENARKQIEMAERTTWYDPSSEVESLEYLEGIARENAEALANNLENTAMLTSSKMKAAGVARASISSEIKAILSETGVRDIGRITVGAVNRSYNMGREYAGYTRVNEIKMTVRSVVLDLNACRVCLAKDQVEHEIGDPRFSTPDTGCLGRRGGNECRCIDIHVHVDQEGELETKSINQYEKDVAEIEAAANIDTSAKGYKRGDKATAQREVLEKMQARYNIE